MIACLDESSILSDSTLKIVITLQTSNYDFFLLKANSLQLLKKYEVSYDKVLIQVDFAFNNELEFSNVLFFEALPFIKENKLIEVFL